MSVRVGEAAVWVTGGCSCVCDESLVRNGPMCERGGAFRLARGACSAAQLFCGLCVCVRACAQTQGTSAALWRPGMSLINPLHMN